MLLLLMLACGRDLDNLLHEDLSIPEASVGVFTSEGDILSHNLADPREDLLFGLGVIATVELKEK